MSFDITYGISLRSYHIPYNKIHIAYIYNRYSHSINIDMACVECGNLPETAQFRFHNSPAPLE